MRKNSGLFAIAMLVGCAGTQEQAAVPIAPAPEAPTQAEAAPVAAAPADALADEAAPVPAKPDPDVINVVLGGISLTFKVDDLNEWGLALEPLRVGPQLQATAAVERKTGKTTVAVASVFKEAGELATVASLIAKQLPNATDVVPVAGIDGVEAEFAVSEQGKEPRIGKIVVLDVGLADRYVIVVGVVGDNRSAEAVAEMFGDVKLAATTLKIAE